MSICLFTKFVKNYEYLWFKKAKALHQIQHNSGNSHSNIEALAPCTPAMKVISSSIYFKSCPVHMIKACYTFKGGCTFQRLRYKLSRLIIIVIDQCFIFSFDVMNTCLYGLSHTSHNLWIDFKHEIDKSVKIN